MAPTGNGNGTMKILGWIGGTTIAVLTIGFTIYSTFHVPLANAIATEKDQRIVADLQINESMQTACLKNQEERSAIEKQLAIILTKLDRIEKKVEQ